MTRKEILKSPYYWTAMIQVALYNCAERVTKGYVTQLLNGEYDHRLSKMVKLALAFGYVPQVTFVSVEKIIEKDSFESKNRWNLSYEKTVVRKDTKVKTGEWESLPCQNKEAA